MHPSVEQYLRDLAGDQPTIADWPARVSEVITQWDAYFDHFVVRDEAEQLSDVRAIIRGRLNVGVVSIAAPTLPEFGLTAPTPPAP